jgi:ABC-type antimicrobial peptide transport system permease subunit
VGLVSPAPLYAGSVNEFVFSDKTVDFRPANAAAQVFLYKVSPEYFHAAGTALLSGRTVTWHDDKAVQRVAVVNAEFARKIFGSVAAATGGHYKMEDGTRIEVVGIVEQGKYRSVTEEAKPAMFFPFLQSPSSDSWIVVRSNRDSQQLGPAIRSTLLGLDTGLPVYIQTWTKEMERTLFAARMATLTLGVLGIIAAMLSITGIFGTAAYAVSKRMQELGIRMALGAQRKHVLQAALGPAVKLLLFGSVAGLILGILASRVLASIVYQATSRDPLVLAGVVVAMSLLGLLATWIPAQRALAIDPLRVQRDQ